MEEEESEKEKALEKEKQLPPGSRCPSTSSGRGYRIVNNPDKLKGKEYVNRQPYFPGAQKRVGGWPAYVRAVPP